MFRVNIGIVLARLCTSCAPKLPLGYHEVNLWIAGVEELLAHVVVEALAVALPTGHPETAQLPV